MFRPGKHLFRRNNNDIIRKLTIFIASLSSTMSLYPCSFFILLHLFRSLDVNFLVNLLFPIHYACMFTQDVCVCVLFFFSLTFLFMGKLINASNVEISQSCKHQHQSNDGRVMRAWAHASSTESIVAMDICRRHDDINRDGFCNAHMAYHI